MCACAERRAALVAAASALARGSAGEFQTKLRFVAASAVVDARAAARVATQAARARLAR